MIRIEKQRFVGNGGVTMAEGLILASLVHAYVDAFGSILEIGTALGVSTRFMSEALPDGKIITFDPRPQTDFTDRNNVHQEIRCAEEAIKLYDKGEFEMAFIDGNHEAPHPHNDLRMCADLCIPLIVMHDASGEYWPDVPAAIAEFRAKDDGTPRYHWIYLPTECGLAVGLAEGLA